MKRRFLEFCEEVDYFSILRWEYVRIIRRYWIRRIKKLKAPKKAGKVVVWTFIIATLILGIFIGYKYPSIGFSNYTTPTGEFQRGKTLWDWIQLLVIPLVLASLAYYFTAAQRDKELAITQIEKREDALQRYFDYMTRLLIEQEYPDEELYEGASRLIRARTLTTLEMIDGRQKGYLLRFLIETELIDRKHPYFLMRGANLIGLELEPGLYSNFNLDGTKLDNAILAGCHFQDAHMNSITMINADLEKAVLDSASLQYALLNRSDLYGVDLSKASLIKAQIQDANLEKAKLRETILNRANLGGGESIWD